ncbi:MAG: peptidylprolyl isomerase [bacterium]|nr:peptidylprolyl isomerase [bacterium]
MRKLTVLMVLALLAVAAVAVACPRDKGDTTTIEVADSGTPADDTTVVDGGSTPQGDTNVDVDITTEGGDTQTKGGDTTEGGDTATEGGDKAADGAGGDTSTDSGDKAADPAAGLPKVVLETTKGDIVLAIHHDWAPIGAKHFLELVNAGFYNGAPWFRVMDGFMAQTGIAADPAVTAKWQNQTIQDEPVKQGNGRGMVSFGKSGAPNSRSTHIFINYADNSGSLDPQGFSAFAEVVEGMDVADKLLKTGDGTVDQMELSSKGIAYFKSKFPDGDVITRAYVKK